jgi:hypothetical protein
MTISTSLETAGFHEAAAGAFAERIGNVLDAGAVSLMLSLGHRTGLFDVLEDLPLSPSSQVAERAELAERYVREWLAAMVTGGVVRYDPMRRTYCLAPEHAACLTRNAPLGNLAVYGQYMHSWVSCRTAYSPAPRAGKAPATRSSLWHLCSILAQDFRLPALRAKGRIAWLWSPVRNRAGGRKDKQAGNF